MMVPSISVIVAAYNVENYIVETIESLLSQTVQASEIIIINDGSTDGTLEILNSMYGHDRKIKVVTQENQGVGGTRMRGFSEATGDYLFFCDPDDVVDPNLFDGFTKAVNENPALELYYYSKRSFVDGVGERSYLKRNTAPSREGWFNTGVELLEDLLLSNKYKATTWQYIFKKDITGRFEVSFKGRAHEDQLFSMNVYLHSKLCYGTQADLYFQRIRQGSLTNSLNDEQYISDSYEAYRHTLAALKIHLIHFRCKQQVAAAFMRRGVIWTLKGCIKNSARLPPDFFQNTRRDAVECGVDRHRGIIFIFPEWHFIVKKTKFLIRKWPPPRR